MSKLDIAIEALRWISEHETDEEAIDQRGACDNDAFHGQRQDGSRCPVCFSRWWATDGSLPASEGSYALGAVAAQALAVLADQGSTEVASSTPGDNERVDQPGEPH